MYIVIEVNTKKKKKSQKRISQIFFYVDFSELLKLVPMHFCIDKWQRKMERSRVSKKK